MQQDSPGSVLLSHKITLAVPSAPTSLTSEFGMGSGMASSISPPEWLVSKTSWRISCSFSVRGIEEGADDVLGRHQQGSPG